jgi:hypothetical protein
MMYMIMTAGSSLRSIFLFSRFSRCARSSGVRFLMNSGAWSLPGLLSSTVDAPAFSSELRASSPLDTLSTGGSAMAAVLTPCSLAGYGEFARRRRRVGFAEGKRSPMTGETREGKKGNVSKYE